MNSSGDFSFRISRDSGAVVVTVQGKLDLAGSTRLGAVIADLVDGQGNLCVAVNLRDVVPRDRATPGVFTAAAKLARQRGGELRVVPPPDGRTAPALASAGGGHAHEHLVEFYDSDAFLAESVRDYVAAGLHGGEAVLVVATEAHRSLFDQALAEAGVDLGAARAAGRYVERDAEEVLSQFMVDGAVDTERCKAVLRGVVAGMARSRRPVRAYGEMVAVLWAAGNVRAAITLEDVWNSLGRARRFSLLCAYPVTAFDGPVASGAFRTVCEQHAPPFWQRRSPV